ncbi:MAG: winged helix-turn-helix domain-containing protein [Candidatus Ratteibacteria bacterium]|nr:winged helix-turn-helix domain-containing protein [Candidatus Ratteibacteria bacterium]
MITEIGIVAGEIWQYLEKYNEATLSQIVKAIDRERDLVMLSLGWLGREGHILIVKEGDEYKITFRKKE